MEMCLDVKPVHDEAWSCLEDLIISAASWLGYDYQLMFSEAWNFIFQPSQVNPTATLGERLHEGEDRSWQLLDRYHGIHLVTDTTITAADACKVIKDELSRKLPVIVYINAFWCPWTNVYQKSYFTHTCLAIGSDDTHDELICIDPYTTKNVERLAMHNFNEGFEKYAVFDIKNGTVADIQCRTIFADAAKRMLDSVNNINSFNMMTSFADAIEKSLDLAVETQGNSDLLKSLLYERLKYLCRRRLQFSQLLKYLVAGGYLKDAATLIEGFNRAAQLWEIIRNILIKSYYLPERQPMQIKAANRIREAAAHEEKLAGTLANFGRGVMD